MKHFRWYKKRHRCHVTLNKIDHGLTPKPKRLANVPEDGKVGVGGLLASQHRERVADVQIMSPGI
jgi:hypothetical protein